VTTETSTSAYADAYTGAQDAAKALLARIGAAPDMALVMGSGWVPAAAALGETEHEFPVTDLPGFAPPTALGHAGKIRVVRLAASGKLALVFLGRTHLYEGHGVASVFIRAGGDPRVRDRDARNQPSHPQRGRANARAGRQHQGVVG